MRLPDYDTDLCCHFRPYPPHPTFRSVGRWSWEQSGGQGCGKYQAQVFHWWLHGRTTATTKLFGMKVIVHCLHAERRLRDPPCS